MARENKNEGAFEQVGEALGGMAGRMAGRATDAAMDLAGSLMGPALQGLGSWWSSADARRAVDSFGEQDDLACREHFEQEPVEHRDYDTTRPVYQFGHTAGHNPDYQGRSFREVEPELERVWEQAGRERFGDWPEVRRSVAFGYQRRSGSTQER